MRPGWRGAFRDEVASLPAALAAASAAVAAFFWVTGSGGPAFWAAGFRSAATGMVSPIDIRLVARTALPVFAGGTSRAWE